MPSLTDRLANTSISVGNSRIGAITPYSTSTEQKQWTFPDRIILGCHDLDNVGGSLASRQCSPATDSYNISKTTHTPAPDAWQIFHPSSYERGFNTSAYVGIFLCTVGIVINLLLFVIIFSTRRLRHHYLYVQILNIAFADLSYIVMVDSFTVYFELQSWGLGAVFCKVWMILDVALPSVSLIGLLVLNLDRIIFAYKTKWYQLLMRRNILRVVIIVCPWCISCVTVNTLWLGFPAVTEEPIPGACVYGITKEANTASFWLTVFIPSLVIFVMLIFIFIAGIGEMPPVDHMSFGLELLNNTGSISQSNCPIIKIEEQEEQSSNLQARNHSRAIGSMTNISQSGRQRRFVAALLAVDFVSLAITLPYSAYIQVDINCKSIQTCQSFVALFQILSWMKSSVTCIRPVFFILLTDIYLSFMRHLARYFLPPRVNNEQMLMLDTSQQVSRCSRFSTSNTSYENVNLTQTTTHNLYSSTSTTVTISAQSMSSGKCQELNQKFPVKPETTELYTSIDLTKGSYV